MTEKHKISQLRALKFFCLLSWMIFGALLMAGLFAVSLVETLLTAFGLLFPVWLLVLFLLSIKLGASKCPRCGEYFHSTRKRKDLTGFYRYNLFSQKCLHCALDLN